MHTSFLAFWAMPGSEGLTSLPLSMLILFVSAKLLAEVAEQFHQPGLVGEILAGVLIGPSVLGWLKPTEFLGAMGDLGAMFLLFRVGLEVKSSELMRVGGTALLVACSGVVVPFVLGVGLLLLYGAQTHEAIFVGASLVATSVGITAHVLSAKGLLGTTSSKVILAAAVIDDVLGLLVLAVVSSLAHGRIDAVQLCVTAIAAGGFTVLVAKWGGHAVRRTIPHVERTLKATEARFVLALSVLFGLACLAMSIGVAAIVGSFLAGLAFSDSAGSRERDLAEGVSQLLVPFFLAGIGLQVELSAFTNWSTAGLALLLLAVALISKFVGCGLGALPLGRTDALRVGVGMIPRGEVGMIVAQLGLALGFLSRRLYGLVVFMSVATTIVAPPLIRIAYGRQLVPATPDIAADETLRLADLI